MLHCLVNRNLYPGVKEQLTKLQVWQANITFIELIPKKIPDWWKHTSFFVLLCRQLRVLRANPLLLSLSSHLTLRVRISPNLLWKLQSTTPCHIATFFVHIGACIAVLLYWQSSWYCYCYIIIGIVIIGIGIGIGICIAILAIFLAGVATSVLVLYGRILRGQIFDAIEGEG